MDKMEAAKKKGEYVRENREQLARFQLEGGPCIPLPKPRLRLEITGQKRRASQSQPGDADDEDDGQRRVKSKTSPTQSNLLDGETRKRVREAANESRLMERESANGSSEARVKREKSESNERSATPQAQTGPRFNDNKYMEEYQKHYNRAMLDIVILRSLGDAERTTIQDEEFRDTLMEEFKERMCSLTNATENAWKIFKQMGDRRNN
ncbi:hypothetical protein G3M48_000522 [Beauveria asiatica]|uniref:Uncharacterized protein n=1 Tax=Beauveria asiatica TaxID=1069075 RepID=A0AAW0RGM0_9HYPO